MNDHFEFIELRGLRYWKGVMLHKRWNEKAASFDGGETV